MIARTTLPALLLLLALLTPSPTPSLDSRPHLLYLPQIARQAQPRAQAAPRIIAFLPDGLAGNDADEVIILQNVGQAPVRLSGWRLSDGEGEIQLPALWLEPQAMLICARQAAAFRQEWGRAPDCEYEQDTDPTVPDAVGNAPRLANSGDELHLLNPAGEDVDVVVYGQGDASISGWQGDALDYYNRNASFAKSGQIFYRLFDPDTLLPLTDTDSARDWAQGNTDPARGRRAAYPGWGLYTFIRPAHVRWTTPPPVTVLVAPDNLLHGANDLLASAQESILLEIYELEHPSLVTTLAARAQSGVRVEVLVEGAPTGGLSDQSRWAAQQIVQAGGQVRFMVNDLPGAHDRYPYLHAKFAIVDGQTLLISTENATLAGMPVLTEEGETAGHRGYALVITDPQLAARASAVFAHDADDNHNDIFTWQPDHPTYGAPPPGYTPPPPVPGHGYLVQFAQPWTLSDASEAYLFTAPEASLSPGPLLDLLAQAGAGDTILVEQLYEHPYWGASTSNPVADPNPRLEALIAAARRGARVRLLLDAFYDDPSQPRSNASTIDYVNDITGRVALDLIARRANPSAGGLHAKLHLITLGSQRWVVLGSLNGGEASNKLNREMAIALQSAGAFTAFSRVFWWDWASGASTP